MHFILFVVGIALAATGLLAIGFGLPVKEFSFGNTLIIAGTIAVVGGFLLVALSSVLRQLMRLAETDFMRAPAMPPTHHAGDPFQPRQPLPSQPSMATNAAMAQPLAKPESPRPAAQAESKFTITPSTEPDQLAWLRPKNAMPTFGEQAIIEEMEASLSPVNTAPPAASSPRLVSSAPSEARPAHPNQPVEPVMDPNPGMRQEPGRAAPPVEHANPTGMFDTVWPEIKPARSAESVARARKPDAVAPQREDQRPTQPTPEAQPPRPEEPRPVAILKSGMIDGMAYTLYADGSIEAVLASGPIRFASIDALRLHLEKNA